jgi:alpha-N-arabinofuranosidase
MGAEALAVEIESVPAGSTGRPAISATASTRGGSAAVTLVNRDYRRALTVTITIGGRATSGRVLTADSPAAVNSPSDPDRVSPRPLEIQGRGPGGVTVTLPPHSTATIEFAIHAAEGH